ncbi:Bax inhibitor-1/YccA family protein [Brevibacterium litoralis]|uniref:Bax inhibitor-1/YccA family protein n=1 Tax=Brevibacterium litoralis TaxID=3138935 RepID=UPI0032F08F55
MSNPLMGRMVKQGVRDARSPQYTDMDAARLQEMYSAPAAGPEARPQKERALQFDDVIMKTAINFAILLVGAAVGWMVPILGLPAMLVGLVLALIICFKKEPSKGLVIAYSAVEGVFLGGISALFDAMYPGIVVQAVLATLSVAAVCFGLYKFRIVRVTSGFNKFLLFAVGGYAVFSLVNFVFAMATGTGGARTMEISIMGIDMPLGILISGIAVILASMTLISDFNQVEVAVQNQVPEKYSWFFAFSLMTTLIWLYIEILRILSYIRGGD